MNSQTNKIIWLTNNRSSNSLRHKIMFQISLLEEARSFIEMRILRTSLVAVVFLLAVLLRMRRKLKKNETY